MTVRAVRISTAVAITFRVSRRDIAKCIVVTRVCVSVSPRPRAYTIARTRM